mmetsp:Transcript_64197/g.150697  ORF Transcript_64197/g.150697 Transcript_64197/m.150697 type:complete len:448 (+) Transcript_64197:27-1370(+)
MGIKSLGKHLKTTVPSAMNDQRCASEYKGTTVAIDASPCLYQCLTAMGDTPPGVAPGSAEDTSHVAGLLRRTVRLLELGFKPIFVFDGDAPEMKKGHVLVQRQKMRAKSAEQLEEAQAAGDGDGVKRHSARLVKTTQRHNDEAMELLRFMGVPAVQADGEAEALCAALAIAGHAHAAATEDFDALVFGAPRLLRNLHKAAASPQIPLVQDIRLESVLGALGFSQAEFVDFCILAGCDYLTTIPKVGIVTAQKLVAKHRRIEAVLENLDRDKYVVPDEWDFQSARSCFQRMALPDARHTALKDAPVDVGRLRVLLLEKYRLPQEMVDDCFRRLMVVKPPPPVSGLRAAPAPPRQRSARAPSGNGRRPATPMSAPPPGQGALAKAFAQGKRKPSNECEPSPDKRHRKSLEALIKEKLGGDILLPSETALGELERLACGLTEDDGVQTID